MEVNRLDEKINNLNEKIILMKNEVKKLKKYSIIDKLKERVTKEFE